MSVFKKLKISKYIIIPSAVVLVVILVSAVLFIRWYQPQKDTPLLRTDDTFVDSFTFQENYNMYRELIETYSTYYSGSETDVRGV